MKILSRLSLTFIVVISVGNTNAQSIQDSLDIKQVALDYIEAQHNTNPKQFERAAHPRMVKRTFAKNKATGKEYLRETFTDFMVILSEFYNSKGDKFPENPKKEVILLDVSDRTASIKLIADDWIDYMHIAKINGTWKIVNVLWQYNNSSLH
ncbi:nuclear transport factor 2 family protein [Aquimarina sediminis]|uniref:nuclear transport factor 2 family protein n=1 Tax=Aquimarina sediminis TaxID=2070536 RepID=UPI000CA04044|nr:nuclear transport factor 2 family protein [Aquimarina sediminis]